MEKKKWGKGRINEGLKGIKLNLWKRRKAKKGSKKGQNKRGKEKWLHMERKGTEKGRKVEGRKRRREERKNRGKRIGRGQKKINNKGKESNGIGWS